MTIRERSDLSTRGDRRPGADAAAQGIVVPANGETGRRGYLVAKRVFDIVGAFTLLLALAPVWLLTALLVRLSSRGPVLYGQPRCGRDGRLFTCYKFRTMVPDAHDRRPQLLAEHDVRGPLFKLPDDPRATRFGRWLRRASMDELPQLLNILRGEMSLVGPRPAIPEEVALYSRHQRQRLLVKPGLTGLWQVSGRSDLSVDRWIELDLVYIRRRSFWFDLWLVLCTVPAVLTGRGAY